MDANTAAILTFAGGVLAFMAAVLPIIARIWERAEPDTRSNFLLPLGNIAMALAVASALAARYV